MCYGESSLSALNRYNASLSSDRVLNQIFIQFSDELKKGDLNMSDDVEEGISAIQKIAEDSKRLSEVTEILASQVEGLSPSKRLIRESKSSLTW